MISVKTTLETGGKDASNTLETSGEDRYLHSYFSIYLEFWPIFTRFEKREN